MRKGVVQLLRVYFINPMNVDEEVPKNIPVRLGRMLTIADSLGHQTAVSDANLHHELSNPETLRQVAKIDKWDAVVLSSFEHGQYNEMRRPLKMLRQQFPQSVIMAIVPQDIKEPLESNPELDYSVGSPQAEETFKGILKALRSQVWTGIPGRYACREKERIVTHEEPKAGPRTFLMPSYQWMSIEEYFQYSPVALCPDGLKSRKRMSFLFGPGEFPEPKKAIRNVQHARLKHAVDFATMLDDDFFHDPKWCMDFFSEYLDAELNDVVPWACYCIDPAVLDREMVRRAKDAGCRAVICKFNFERLTAAKAALAECSSASVQFVPTFLIDEEFEHLLEMVDFADKNQLPFNAEFPTFRKVAKDGTLFSTPSESLFRSFLKAGLEREASKKNIAVLAALTHSEPLLPLHAEKWGDRCLICREVFYS